MYACDAVGVNAPTERLLSVGIQCDDRGSVVVTVADNGIGLRRETQNGCSSCSSRSRRTVWV
jgi:nitrogen fixation/metabolism regulation signal transduction histidine kinase